MELWRLRGKQSPEAEGSCIVSPRPGGDDGRVLCLETYSLVEVRNLKCV